MQGSCRIQQELCLHLLLSVGAGQLGHTGVQAAPNSFLQLARAICMYAGRTGHVSDLVVSASALGTQPVNAFAASRKLLAWRNPFASQPKSQAPKNQWTW